MINDHTSPLHDLTRAVTVLWQLKPPAPDNLFAQHKVAPVLLGQSITPNAPRIEGDVHSRSGTGTLKPLSVVDTRL